MLLFAKPAMQVVWFTWLRKEARQKREDAWTHTSQRLIEIARRTLFKDVQTVWRYTKGGNYNRNRDLWPVPAFTPGHYAWHREARELKFEPFCRTFTKRVQEENWLLDPDQVLIITMTVVRTFLANCYSKTKMYKGYPTCLDGKQHGTRSGAGLS